MMFSIGYKPSKINWKYFLSMQMTKTDQTDHAHGADGEKEGPSSKEHIALPPLQSPATPINRTAARPSKTPTSRQGLTRISVSESQQQGSSVGWTCQSRFTTPTILTTIDLTPAQIPRIRNLLSRESLSSRSSLYYHDTGNKMFYHRNAADLPQPEYKPARSDSRDFAAGAGEYPHVAQRSKVALDLTSIYDKTYRPTIKLPKCRNGGLVTTIKPHFIKGSCALHKTEQSVKKVLRRKKQDEYCNSPCKPHRTMSLRCR